MKIMPVALAVGLSLAGVAGAGTSPANVASKVDPSYLPYAHPDIVATIARGQKIHFKCMGSGSPTVLLTAGMGGWAADWRKVQADIAKTTRVCAWDRPGFGFSSGTMQPQTTANLVRDLEAGLKSARIGGPFVAVGHSMGSFETLLFKDRNPASVVGMVLVDPSIPDQDRLFRRVAPVAAKAGDASMKAQRALLARCLAGLRSGKLKRGGKDPDHCLDDPPELPRELAQQLAIRDVNPLRLTAVLSLVDNFAADSAALVNAKRNYGDMPLIVLTATKKKPPSKDAGPPTSPKEEAAMDTVWMHAHDQIAALSTRGVNRPVASTHYIQYDQPKVVVDAVTELVKAARSRPGAASATRR